ncbi:MAG: protein-glutamate O-methyltransferase CheR [Coleofasciculus sp. S288]|nr:protein-glutamate O-methyltransferase CheR [Coleofasciculus sp. S288]
MVKSESLNEGLLQNFIQLVAKHTGLEIRERDQSNLSEQILLRMKSLKLYSPENYYQLLDSNHQDNHQEWQNLITLVTNGESFFFRDKEQFLILRNHILPELIQRKKNHKVLRLCSAGCSSGEEPYSLAILLKELIPDLEQWNLTILGIDINQVALQKAKTGVYRPWSFRNVSPEIKRRYFRAIDNEYCLDPSIKQMVKFQTVNLVKTPFPQSSSDLRELDLILCRNVFIYFGASAIAKVLNKFYHSLQPLGYLITGHSELYGQDLSQFQTKVFPESLVYQRQENNGFDTPLVSLPRESTYPSSENLSLTANDIDIEIALEKSNLKMQKTALNLLKQLPPNTKIPRLGNMTASELILQLETALKSMD